VEPPPPESKNQKLNVKLFKSNDGNKIGDRIKMKYLETKAKSKS
jgi:hypothetical protein